MSGTLGRTDLTKNLDVALYQTNDSQLATVTVSFCNRSDSETFVFLAVSDKSRNSPLPSDFLEFNSVVPPFGVLERTGIVIGPNKKVFVKSTEDDVSVMAYGFEDIA